MDDKVDLRLARDRGVSVPHARHDDGAPVASGTLHLYHDHLDHLPLDNG